MDKKIKTIRNYRVNYRKENPDDANCENWVETDSILSSYTEYDREGNLLRSESYNQSGEPSELYTYRYDEKNRPIEEILYYDEDEVAEKRRITWSEDGRKLEEHIEFESGGESTITYTYNGEGLLTEWFMCDADREPEELHTFEYRNKLLISESVNGYDNVPSWKKVMEYDEAGNFMAMDYISPEETDCYRYEYGYDNNNRRIKVRKFDHHGNLVEKTDQEFNESDQLISSTEEDRTSYRKIAYEYDDQGNSVLQTEADTDGNIMVRIDRTFDQEGYLTESTVFIDRHGEGADQLYSVRYEYEFFTGS